MCWRFRPQPYPPKLNGDRNTTPAGTLSGVASALHWPAAVMPTGYSHESLPSGLQLLGRPWSEPILIELAYAYEQATQHRLRCRHSTTNEPTGGFPPTRPMPDNPVRVGFGHEERFPLPRLSGRCRFQKRSADVDDWTNVGFWVRLLN